MTAAGGAERYRFEWRPELSNQALNRPREDLRRFYFDHCGFRPTTAGLIRLDEPLPGSQ